MKASRENIRYPRGLPRIMTRMKFTHWQPRWKRKWKLLFSLWGLGLLGAILGSWKRKWKLKELQGDYVKSHDWESAPTFFHEHMTDRTSSAERIVHVFASLISCSRSCYALAREVSFCFFS